MSNINDLCAKCHRGRWRHTNPRLPGCHVFVEPAPQPAPRGVWTAADIARGKALADGYKDVLPDAAPSGDEAKVREIAERLCTGSLSFIDGAREAYAAGKADGAREERSECENLARGLACPSGDERCLKVGLIADAIARRGSEGT